jgi:hypothetical protein
MVTTTIAMTQAEVPPIETANEPNTKHTERLLQQLQTTDEQLERNIFVMARLHQQWWTYLWVLSCLVMGITLYQFYQSVSTCSHQLSAWKPQPPHYYLLLKHSARHILSTGMSITLTLFLKTSSPAAPSVFRQPYFRVTQYCTGPIMVLYAAQSYEPSCIPVPKEEVNAPTFPVVVVFFVIATVSVALMQQQRKQMRTSQDAVRSLQKELQGAAKNKQE